MGEKTKYRRGDMFKWWRYRRKTGILNAGLFREDYIKTEETIVLLSRRYLNHGKIRMWRVWNISTNKKESIHDFVLERDAEFLARPQK